MIIRYFIQRRAIFIKQKKRNLRNPCLGEAKSQLGLLAPRIRIRRKGTVRRCAAVYSLETSRSVLYGTSCACSAMVTKGKRTKEVLFHAEFFKFGWILTFAMVQQVQKLRSLMHGARLGFPPWQAPLYRALIIRTVTGAMSASLRSAHAASDSIKK
jgi:hypothetical protein